MTRDALLQSTPDDHFQAFLRSTDEKCLIGRTMSALFRALRDNKALREGDTLSVYDMGCGHGDFAVALAEGAFDSGIELDYTGVDLSRRYVEQAAERMGALGFAARGHKADLFTDAAVPEACDIISASHALYYTKFQPNEAAALPDTLERWEKALKPGGFMLFVHQSAKSPWLKFSKALGDSKFDKIEKQTEKHCKKLGLPTVSFTLSTRIAFPELGAAAADLGDIARYGAHAGDENFRHALMLVAFAAEGRPLAELAESGRLQSHAARMLKARKTGAGHLQTEQIVRIVLRRQDAGLLPAFRDAVTKVKDVEREIVREASEALRELAEAETAYAWLKPLTT